MPLSIQFFSVSMPIVGDSSKIDTERGTISHAKAQILPVLHILFFRDFQRTFPCHLNEEKETQLILRLLCKAPTCRAVAFKQYVHIP
jgi:hypothetical protein